MFGIAFVWTVKDVIALSFALFIIALYAFISVSNWIDARRANKRDKNK